MRKAKRSETPGGFTRRKPPIEIDGHRADSIHNPSMTEHERAVEALARMKELEAKKKMLSVRIDSRTVVSSCSNKLLEQLCEDIRKANP